MFVNATVLFPNQSRLLLVNQIFDASTLEQIDSLFVDVHNNPDWQAIPEFAYRPGRLVYRGNSPVLNTIQQSLALLQPAVDQALGFATAVVNFDLWCDLPGYQIPPHYDREGHEYALQVYVGDPKLTWEMLGTAVYLDEFTPLFEMHYKTNSGYLIDTTQTILHGLNHRIPDQYLRMHVYTRYRRI